MSQIIVVTNRNKVKNYLKIEFGHAPQILTCVVPPSEDTNAILRCFSSRDMLIIDRDAFESYEGFLIFNNAAQKQIKNIFVFSQKMGHETQLLSLHTSLSVLVDHVRRSVCLQNVADSGFSPIPAKYVNQLGSLPFTLFDKIANSRYIKFSGNILKNFEYSEVPENFYYQHKNNSKLGLFFLDHFISQFEASFFSTIQALPLTFNAYQAALELIDGLDCHSMDFSFVHGELDTLLRPSESFSGGREYSMKVRIFKLVWIFSAQVIDEVECLDKGLFEKNCQRLIFLIQTADLLLTFPDRPVYEVFEDIHRKYAGSSFEGILEELLDDENGYTSKVEAVA